MLNKIIKAFFLCFLLLALIIEHMCFAYSLDTHEKITWYSIFSLEYSNDALPGKLKDYYGTIKDADIAEDNAPNWLKHFYNPATGLGLLGSLETARFRAEGFYNNALYYYLKGNESYAWDQIGHALHLLQDMSVPAHVQGTSHAYHTKRSVGYEYLTTQNWQGISSYVDWLHT